MTEVKNAKHIGMRRAAALANLTLDQQLDLICEGLRTLSGVASGWGRNRIISRRSCGSQRK
jgi:hypothetical protein